MTAKPMVKPLTYGRMGNFLFQAATAMAYAWRHGLEFSLPSETKSAKHNPIYLQHLVNPLWSDGFEQVVIEEKQFCFQELPFKEEWRYKNIILDGYWQTEKYFKEYRDRILAAFGYPYEGDRWKGFVSIHVRRGDYLKLKNKHPEVPASWIQAAMRKFPGHHFCFFSDDIQWCQFAFGGRQDCSFSEGHDPETDLIRMSWCEHQICSASTFSWWGAWLNRNPNKRIIMPKLWYMPGHGGLDTKDIVPAQWERL